MQYDVMTWKLFRCFCPLWVESIGDWWIPLTNNHYGGALTLSLRNKLLKRRSIWQRFETPRRSCIFLSIIILWLNIIGPSQKPLQWRHKCNKRDGVSNHQPHHCVYSTVYLGADEGKHPISASLTFVYVCVCARGGGVGGWGIHRWPYWHRIHHCCYLNGIYIYVYIYIYLNFSYKVIHRTSVFRQESPNIKHLISEYR